MVYKKPEFKVVAKSYTLDDPKKLFNNIHLNFVQNLMLTPSCQDIKQAIIYCKIAL